MQEELWGGGGGGGAAGGGSEADLCGAVCSLVPATSSEIDMAASHSFKYHSTRSDWWNRRATSGKNAWRGIYSREQIKARINTIIRKGISRPLSGHRRAWWYKNQVVIINSAKPSRSTAFPAGRGYYNNLR